MRMTHLAQVVAAFVAIVACTPAKQPRTATPAALSQPRDAAAPENRDEGLGDAPKPDEQVIRVPGTVPQSRSSAGADRDAALAATAAENAARGPAAERPMWGDPAGIDIGTAASDLRTILKPLVAPHDRPRAKRSPPAAESQPAAGSSPDGESWTDGK